MNVVKFTYKVVTFGVLHTSPFCLFLMAYMRDMGLEISLISAMMTVKKISRFVVDVPFGILFDKIGAKNVMLISRIVKIVSFLLMLNIHNFTLFFLGIMLNGISYSAFYGKYNAYIYNVLKVEDKTKLFHKITSLYYLIGDVYIVLISIFAMKVKAKFGYSFLILISCIPVAFSSMMLFFLPDNRLNNEKNKSFKLIIQKSIAFFKEKTYVLYFVIVSSIASFFGWQAGIMTSIIMLDMGFKTDDTVKFGIYAKVLTGISSFVVYRLKKPFNIKSCFLMLNSSIFIFLCLAFIYKPQLIYVLVLYSLIHLFIQIGMEKHFEDILDQSIRGTLTSLSWLFSTLISILITSLMSIVKHNGNFGYKNTMISIVATMLVVCFVSSVLYLRKMPKE